MVFLALKEKMKIERPKKTKHLVGTKDEAPEYYRFWED